MKKTALKNYFTQCFKQRGKDDYNKLFSRGRSGGKIYNEYPWFYLRVLGVLFAVFAIYSVTVSALYGSGMDRLPFYLLGGAFLDIAMLVLLYELYPHNDFSFLKLICVCLIAGSAAAFLSSLLYEVCSLAGLHLLGWDLPVVAGIGEEIAKTLPVIVCITVLKSKKNPLGGFLIGAAVGTWFSLTENASYMWSYWTISGKILTAVIRSFGCFFSHAVWTALIGWAYCKFKKPFINIRFYGVVLFCIAMHFCIDMPLDDYRIILYAEAAVCGVATLAFGAAVFYKERKKILSSDAPVQTERSETACPYRKANLTAVGFGVVMCALLLTFSAVYRPYTYEKTFFDTQEQFIAFAQNGYVFSPDEEREYDENCLNYTEYFEYDEELGEKVLLNCEQRVSDGDITYVYIYALLPADAGDDSEIIIEDDTNDAADDADGEEPIEKTLQLTRVDVILAIDGEEQRFNKITYLDFDDDSELAFYPINEELSHGYREKENGKHVFYKRVERLGWKSITMISVCSAVALADAVTYIIMRKKAKAA